MSDFVTNTGFSYVIPGRIAGMAHPGYGFRLEDNVKHLISIGITGMVSLTEYSLSPEILETYQMEYLHLPIPDFTAPNIEQAEKMAEFVDRIAQTGKAVVVHCHAGRGRTGTMLAAYLVRTGMNADMAIFRIRQLRPGSIETEEQEQFLYEYQGYLEKKAKTSEKS